jgi:predicted permease
MVNELRLALRRLNGARTFAGVAILTLAIGTAALGATAAVAHAVFVARLPFPQADRIVVLNGEMRRETIQPWPLGVHDLRSVADANPGMLGPVPVAGGRAFSIAMGDAVEHVTGEFVGHRYFDVFGITPALGRGFTADEITRRTASVVIISDGIWRRHFGSDPAVIGRMILLNDRSVQVVGVAPPGFRGLYDSSGLWLPIGTAADIYQPGYLDVREFRWLAGIGRLDGGVTAGTVEQRIETVLRALEGSFAAEYRGLHITTSTLRDIHFGDLRQPLWILLGAATLLLAIAVTNLASLLLVRGLARQRDAAIRVALGASLRHVLTGVMAEIVLIVVAGAAAGLWIAHLGLPLLLEATGLSLPGFVTPSVNPAVALLTIAVCAFSCLAAALVPARHAATVEPAHLIRAGALGGTRGRRRLQFVLVTAETALAIVLLIGTGLLARGMQALVATDLGFETEGVTFMRLNLASQRYADSLRYVAFAEELIERARAIPGVTHASIEGPGYPTFGSFGFHFWNDNAPAGPEDVMSNRHHVTPGYFSTMGIPLRAGRDFTRADRLGAANVLIVSQEFADRVWPRENPVGRTIRTSRGTPLTFEVIGVAASVKHLGLDASLTPQPSVYLPLLRFPPRSPAQFTLLVRSNGNDERIGPALRAMLKEADPLMPAVELRPLGERIREQTTNARLLVILMTTFGALALSLAAVGIYGIVAYAVQQSTREIGVRLALGAGNARVLRLVLRQGMTPVVLGITLGSLAVAPLQRALQSQLYGVPAFDPVALGSALLALSAVAVAATLVPAYRATRIDAVTAIQDK